MTSIGKHFGGSKTVVLDDANPERRIGMMEASFYIVDAQTVTETPVIRLSKVAKLPYHPGQPIFYIKNAGSQDFNIVFGPEGGEQIKICEPGMLCQVILLSNKFPALEDEGIWAIKCNPGSIGSTTTTTTTTASTAPPTTTTTSSTASTTSTTTSTTATTADSSNTSGFTFEYAGEMKGKAGIGSGFFGEEGL